MPQDNPSIIAFNFGVFIGLIALALGLPELDTFLIDFRDVSVNIVRVFQYSLFFIAFAYLSEVVA
jgi:hypothetical protein